MSEKEDLLETEEENKTKEQPIGKALAAFIIAVIGLASSFMVVFSLPGLVLGIIGLAFSNNSKDVTRKPFVAFKNIARPLSIVAVIMGAILTTLATIGLIVWAVYIVIKNGNQAPSQIGLF